MHEDSKEFISKVATYASSMYDIPPENMETFFLRRLVFSLFRGISAAINGKLKPRHQPGIDYTFNPELIRSESPFH